MEQRQLFNPLTKPIKSDKEHLLDEIKTVGKPTQRLTITTLFISILGILLLCAILLPKIYLRNSIYYESRIVTKLEHQYAILKEERELLKEKIETIRYQNQVEDTLF